MLKNRRLSFIMICFTMKVASIRKISQRAYSWFGVFLLEVFVREFLASTYNHTKKDIFLRLKF